tara:strand:+ start:109 stop:429 length:321 start_codon:yes stop_codon:yes gene_type:complete
MLQEIVDSMGYKSHVVHRATEAFKVLDENVISLILLDIKIPTVRGHQFVRYLCKQGKRMPIIVVSAYLTPEVMETLLEYQIRKVIVKAQFKIQRLAQDITDLLGTN